MLKSKSIWRPLRKALAGVSTVAVVAGLIVAGGTTAAQAADPAALDIVKKVNVRGDIVDLPEKPTVSVGEDFEWIIQITCQQQTDQCINATFTDTIPEEFEIIEDSINSVPAGNITVTGQAVSIAFQERLAVPAGEVGLSAGANVTIPVRLRAIPQSRDGEVFTNTGSVKADNTPEASDDAAVTASVALVLQAEASKSFDPEIALVEPGSPVALTFGGKNTSNGAVSKLVVQDPADPQASPNIFQQYLQVDGLTSATWPQGAENAVVSVWDTTTNDWVSGPEVAAPAALALPALADAQNIGGVRIEFTAANPVIPTNATTSVQLALSQRTSVSTIDADAALANVSLAQVAAGTESSPEATADATLTLRPASTLVAATKDISPAEIAVVGETTQATVTLGAINAGTRPLQGLTIKEPTNPADLSSTNMLSPAFTGGGVTFSGFGSVQWPNGATDVSVTYYFADGTTETVTASAADANGSLPEHTSTERVTGFSVNFTGEIVDGAEASVPFTVDAPESLGGPLKVTGTNTIQVDGQSPAGLPAPEPDTASDDLTIYDKQISIVTEKTLTDEKIWSIPGQTTTARLKTTILPYPKTTENVNQVIIDDPSVTDGVTGWYDRFNATGITLTQIPTNATLTVQWRDADGVFRDIPGMVDLPGGIFTGAISLEAPYTLEDVAGIRFIYNSESGFVPGQSLVPNISYTTRGTSRLTGDQFPSNHSPRYPGDLEDPLLTVENCSASEASSDDLQSERVEVEPPCPEIDLMPIGDGVGPDLLKQWNPDVVFSHSGQNTTVNLGWTAGVQGLDKIVISDVATDAVTGKPLAQGNASVFDSFNLTRIGAINDPLFAFDSVQVQVFNGVADEWQDLGKCTAAAPCTGTSIPAIDLSAEQQRTTTAVRFIVTEKPGRVPSAITDPLPGSGVAVGNSAVVRNIPLTLQVRDTRRSDSSPVVDGPIYNVAGEPGRVLNTSSLDAYVGDTATHRDDSSDVIELVDPELGVQTAKSVAGSPLAVPTTWQTPAPTVRYTVSATNTTAGLDSGVGGRVNELTITEPGNTVPANQASPFEAFDLVRFHNLTAPAGTTKIMISFTGTGGPGTFLTDPLSPSLPQVQALTWLQNVPQSTLRNVTGYTVQFFGQIASAGKGEVQFDAELRQFERTDSTVPVTVATHNPVDNTVMGTVTDKRWNDDDSTFVDRSLSSNAEAPVALQGGTISVTSEKAFSPTSQTEPSDAELTMTLAGRPTGTERTKSLVLTDDRATFWNAYDFKRVNSSFTLPKFSPDAAANRLQIEFSICTGRDFTTWATAVAEDATLAEQGCEATGGSWSAYTAPMSDVAAQGWVPANPGDVQGLKMRVTRGGEVQWENPVSPKIETPIVIQRRAELRSGGEVPSTLNDGNPAAPGEAAKGVTTNTVRADVTGAWGDTADHSTDRTLTYRHANNAVEVQKTPIGVRSPGVAFDYTLKVRNTGAREIVDPVITDRLPYDAQLGTLVQFDPDADSSAPKYSFATSGPVSATNPMPLVLGGPNGVAVAEDLDSTTPTMKFTFPTGTRLAVGQSYTITFKMMFVPGVAEGDPVLNAFEISGDRVWDACTAPSGHTPTLSADKTTCATNAMVTPQRLPAIRAVKSVRAVAADGQGYNDHGFADAAACVDRVDGADFASQPCVPRTMPGQAEEWRLGITNNGTTPLNRIVIADLLPTPGDTTLIANFARNSQWAPTLTSTVPTVSGAAGQLESYVTTAPRDAACLTSAVRNPDDAGLAACIDAAGGDAEAATKFVPFSSVSDHSKVTALLFVFSPNEGETIEPGAKIDVQFETRTGAYSVQDASDPGAFNSLTVSALYPRSSTPGSPTSVLAARDQSRSGVALITGSVQIEKSVSGDGAKFVPADQVFSGELVCTSVGQPIPTRPFTVTVDTPVVFDNLPAGASCTVTETSASGQTSYTAGTVVVPDGRETEQLPVIEIENVYGLTELVVTKTVQTDAESIPTGFEFEVVCTFLGQPIDLAAGDARFTLNDGGSHTISGLPVNAKCTVAEVNDRGADSVNVEAQTIDADGAAWGTVTENNPGSSAVIDRLAPVAGTNSADFTNTYGSSAAIRVTKNLVGGAADLGEDQVFTVHAVCTFEGETLLDQDVLLHAGNGWAQTLPSLVAGAECAITESNLNGADAVVITPNDGTDTTTGAVTIPVGATGPVLVDVTNRYLAGSIEVTKAITGEGAELYGTGDFTVELVCTLDGAPVRVIGGAERTLNAGQLTASYTGIPNRAECALTETNNSGATESRVRLGADGEWFDAADPGASFTVNASASVASNEDQAQGPAELENRFDLAEVSVTKHVVSDAVDEEGTPIEYGPFEVELACTFLGEVIEIPGGAVKTLLDGESATWDMLPAGALCEATETDTADAVEVWYEPTAVNPDEGAENAEGAEGAVGPAGPEGFALASAADDQSEQQGEDRPERTDGTVYTFAPLVAMSPQEGVPAANSVALFNAFDSTALTINKSIIGTGASLGADKKFEVELVCTLTDATRPDGAEVWNDTYTLSAANGWRAEVQGIAANAECEITETVRGEANATRVKLGDEVIGADTAKFTVDEPTLTLTVVNTFDALPNTGSNGVAAIAILGAVMMLGGALASATAVRRRKQARHG